MCHKLLVGLLVVMFAVGVYVTNFILFSHALTPLGLAEAVFTIPALTDNQFYVIERRHVTTVSSKDPVIERLYYDHNNHLWIEHSDRSTDGMMSELWLRSPTINSVEKYIISDKKIITRSITTPTEEYHVLYESSFYEWFLLQKQNPIKASAPIVAHQTDWIEQVECYRIDWEIATEHVTAWISADSYRLIKEQRGSNITYYSGTLISADRAPMPLTLVHWLQQTQPITEDN